VSERPAQTRARLVVVTGSGRSGTSTVTGALARLGLHVPGPVAPADERNPKGFYETEWVIGTNGAALDAIPVRGNDARPEAASLADQAAGDPELVHAIRDRLAGHLDGGAELTQLVVKDPQIFWLHRAWRAAADELGVELSFLAMLRHPVEVARSRDTAYLTGKDAEHRRVRQVSNVAAWCNAAYATEAATRGGRRAFVRYDDLLADWRAALAPVAERLALDLDPRMTSGEHHTVDDFVDSSLNRSRSGWEDTDVPDGLRDVAERTWQAVTALADDPDDAAARDALEAARASYASLHADAVALTADHTQAAVKAARREQREQTAERLRGELQQARQRNQRLRARIEELEERPPLVERVLRRLRPGR
jgi:hypothetical protein